jgi:hypothetical protein
MEKEPGTAEDKAKDTDYDLIFKKIEEYARIGQGRFPQQAGEVFCKQTRNFALQRLCPSVRF